jgi:hypothetical protein
VSTAWTAFVVRVLFVNNLPEDGLKGPKHAGGPSQCSKLLFVVVVCSLVDSILNTTDGFWNGVLL